MPLSPATAIKSAIRPSQVLLIVRQGSALSRDVADMYRALRGLGGHELTFAMTPNAAGAIPWSQARTMVLAVADYIATHHIDCVITSADTAIGVTMPYPIIYGISTISLENVLSWSQVAAQFVPDTYNNFSLGKNFATNNTNRLISNPYSPVTLLKKQPREYLYNIERKSGSQFLVDGQWLSYEQVTADYYINNSYVLATPKPAGIRIPAGRIGYGRAHSFIPAESYAACERMVMDALASEVAATLPAARPVHVHHGIVLGSFYPQEELAAVTIANLGHPIRRLGSGILGITYDYAYPNPSIPLKPLWGYIGIAPNESSESAWLASQQRFTYLPGSWTYGGLSFGLSQFGAHALIEGACAAGGSVYEPMAAGLAHPNIVADLLTAGWSMAEVANYANPTNDYFWQLSVWGDPLYRPFPQFGLAHGQSNSLSLTAAEHHLTPITHNRDVAWQA